MDYHTLLAINKKQELIINKMAAIYVCLIEEILHKILAIRGILLQKPK